ncbi:25S rRNA adenine-N(1) methyltransferase [Elsinoe australis]|uniref:25S rRNA adenine-N(1) methyltransferase n=1 Tax=Elsinoe australis TaxID=40998 RepID=A0A2P8A813_9PEZI|nr:25S rRNA adenine-N(1) methyltransferase [Elsinoe australis]
MARSSRQKKSLASGRPGISKPTAAKLSAKAGRTIIRSHHQLNKALELANKAGDGNQADELRRQIEARGGLASYQHASLLGQSDERGGDSSKVLVEWIKPRVNGIEETLKVLEVGALSTTNACSKWKKMAVTRIDLNSQTAGIIQQDFMERPLPTTKDERFDVISLSLVLNYVPDKEGRGRMLMRTCSFLDSHGDVEGQGFRPCLFVVLPAPCVNNSRYMNERHLNTIMNQLGYYTLEQKTTSKLHYSLWAFKAESVGAHKFIKRTEINPGKTRNNFSIVL